MANARLRMSPRKKSTKETGDKEENRENTFPIT